MIRTLRSLGVTVEPLFFLYMLGFWTIFTTLQAFIYRKVCLALYDTDTAICDQLTNATYKSEEEIVQKVAARWFLYSDMCYGFISVLTAGFIGSWGDRFSRKLPLVLPIIGSLLVAIIYVALSFFERLPLWTLLFPSLVQGLFGGMTVIILGVFSYVSTCSDLTNRTWRLSILQAMLSIAGALANSCGGFFLDRTNFTIVFSTIGGILVLALLYAVFCVEDIKENDATNQSASTQLCRDLFSISHVKETVTALCRQREGNKRLYIAVQFLSTFISLSGQIGKPAQAFEIWITPMSNQCSFSAIF